MKKIKNILVPSDFSQSADQALANAVMLAKKFDANITLLHIVTVHDNDPYNPVFDFPQIEGYYEHWEDQVRQKWKDTALVPVDADKVVQRGFSPYSGILEFLSEHDIDLVAMGTHGHSGLAHFFLGSVTEKVVHHADCAVLTARLTKEPVKEVKRFQKVLVPLDFSASSEHALAFAAELLEDGGQLDIVHVMENEIHPAYYSSDVVSLFDFMPHLRTHTQESMQKIVKKNVQRVPNIHYHIAEGSVYKNILEISDRAKSDAIVMGTHGINNLEHIFMGSVANKVLRKASCPVVTLK